MTKPEGESGTRTVAGNFEITHNLTDKRGLRITGYIYSDDTKEEMNSRIDLAMDLVDRQFIRADIMNKEAQIATLTGNLDLVSQGYEEIIAKREGGAKLTSVDKQKIEKYDADVRGMKKHIEFLQAGISAARKKLEE